jgi:EmrB/QacA subfamily drug resistance transporter
MVDSGAGRGFDRALKGVVAVVVLGSFMSTLDSTIVNIALLSLHRDLHAPLVSVQWVVTAYLLSIAAAIPLSGWAARRFGAKQVFVLSVITFTACSMLCGLASSLSELIVFRVLQGFGSGLIMPVGMLLMVKESGAARLPRVMAIYGISVLVAPIVGPTIGGLILDSIGWRWIFYVNLPVGIVATVAAIRLLRRVDSEPAGRLDLAGLVLVGAGLVGVTYGLAQIGATVLSIKVLLPAALGLVLIATFVLHARHVERPLLDIRLYKNKAFSAASLTTFFISAALFGGMILMPLYFQTIRGEDALITGLLVAPQSLGSTVSIWASSRLVERYGGGATALAGCVISLVATIPLVLIGPDTPFVGIAVAMAFRGAGLGLSFIPATTAAYRTLRPEQISDATPQINIIQRIGGSIGTAIVAVVLQDHLNRASSSAGQAAAFGTTFWWILVVSVVAMLPTLILVRLDHSAASTLAVETGSDDLIGR